MRNLWIVILMALAAENAAAGDIYGADGSYKGEVDDGGSIYGADGSYKGEVEDDGSVYGVDGSYKEKLMKMAAYMVLTAAIRGKWRLISQKLCKQEKQ